MKIFDKHKKITIYVLTALISFSCFTSGVRNIDETSAIPTQFSGNESDAENPETKSANSEISDVNFSNDSVGLNDDFANSVDDVMNSTNDFAKNNASETCKESNTVVLRLNDINDLDKLNITENVVGRYDDINSVTIEIPQGSSTEEIIEKYKANPNVKQVFEDAVARLLFTPTDPYYRYQWNLSNIHMESAWNSTSGVPSVVVAVVDTGVDHIQDMDGFVNGVDTSDLDQFSNVIIRKDTYSGQYSNDGGFHGTAVASLIASTFNDIGIAGIAPGVSIMPVKVFEDGVESAYSANIATGIRWATDNGADIINLSLGVDTSTSIMRDAVNYAINHGVMIFAASGNDGKTNSVYYPAAYNDVVAVGCSNKDDSLSSFSNQGNELDLVAPGEDVSCYYSDYDASKGYGPYSYLLSGTSFSSPTVCAVAALVKSKYPSYSNDLIEQILYAGTKDIAAPGWDSQSGYGIIDAGKVMSFAGDANFINDDNNSLATADAIAVGTNYSGNIFPLRDNDYYKFIVPEATWVNIKVTPNGLNDIEFELYNSAALMISRIDKKKAGGQETLACMLNAGAYYINAFDGADYVYANSYSVYVEFDVKPPVIQYSDLSFDLSMFKVSVPVTDDISGVNSVKMTYVSPVSGTFETYALALNTTTNKYEYTPQPNENTEEGVWKIHQIAVSDFNSNSSVLFNSDIAGSETPNVDLSAGNFTVSKSVSELVLSNPTMFFSEIGATEQLTAKILPTFATNKNVVWSTDNPNVATVDVFGKVTATGFGNANIMATSVDGAKTSVCHVTVEIPSINVSYRTHVQDYGWQGYVSNGTTSGTSGQCKRLEAINISVGGNSNLGISYSTHVQDIGWQGFVSNGEMSGTSGQCKRLEAIKICLTGAKADLYDVYYRVHAEDYGWLSWAKNGSAAGTEGLCKRLEAIEIVVVKKTDNVSYDTSNPFVSVYGNALVSYRTHVEDFGWQGFVSDGAMSGTTGKAKRLEAITMRLSTNLPSGSIFYSTHVQDIGWMNSVSDGAISGTSGQCKRLEAIRINLTGAVAQQYDIYYRVHAENIGWMGWAKNGDSAGTAGFSYRLEGIETVLVPKGAPAPGSTADVFIQK